MRQYDESISDTTIVTVSSEKTLGGDGKSNPPSQSQSKTAAARANRMSSKTSCSGISFAPGRFGETAMSYTDFDLPASVVEDSHFRMPAVLEEQVPEGDMVLLRR